MCIRDSINSGAINVSFYPYESNIKVYVNNKQVNTVEQNPFGSLDVVLRDELKDGDRVLVEATCPGWSATGFSRSIY